jgi:hypothetical protein
MAKAKHGGGGHGKGKGNRYKQKAHDNSILHSMTNRSETKGDPKNTAIETVKDLAVGVVGGGLAGAAIGKPSFLVGLGVTGVGHYTGNHLATLFGIGLMAANGFQSKSVSGVDGMDGFSMEAVKERVKAYGDNLKEKLYLDKVMPKKEESANGIGDLQFFQHPNDMSGAYNELNNELSALDHIERQIENSGYRHMQMTGIGMGDMDGYEDMGEVGGYDDMGEVGEVGELGEMGELSDISDRNL